MNLSTIRKRIEALEYHAALRHGDSREADLLSPRDACFLLGERQRLLGEDTPETAILASRIDDLLKRHGRAAAIYRREPMTPKEATEALVETMERTAEDEEEFRHGWLERLGAEREYIREVMDELDSLKG